MLMDERPDRARLTRLLGQAWDAFPMAALMIDQDGTIRHCSDHTNYLLGYEPGRIVGTDIEHLVAKEKQQSPPSGEEPPRPTETRGSGSGIELFVRTQDGGTVPVQVTLTQIVDPEESADTWTLVLMQDRRPPEGHQPNGEIKERYRQLFDQNQVGLVWARPGGKILSCNPAAAQMFGYASADEFEGQSFVDHYRGDLADRRHTLNQLRDEGELSNWNVPMARRDGGAFTILESLTLHGDSQYDGPVIVSSFVEVTEQARLWEELKERASHDPLTGLPNRRFLRRQATQILSLVERRERYAGLAYLDLDGFEVVNDQWGREMGDEVLVSIAQRLQRGTHESDVVARMGEDEFAILWADLDTPDEAVAATRRLLEAFDDPVGIGDKQFSLSASAGISTFPTDAKGIDELLHHADQAMSRAKREGRTIAVDGVKK